MTPSRSRKRAGFSRRGISFTAPVSLAGPRLQDPFGVGRPGGIGSRRGLQSFAVRPDANDKRDERRGEAAEALFPFFCPRFRLDERVLWSLKLTLLWLPPLPGVAKAEERGVLTLEERGREVRRVRGVVGVVDRPLSQASPDFF